ncbi:unnamed protein product [Ixodes hexagonus]
MDPKGFYGVRVPPADESEDSCLSDSDTEYSPGTHSAPSTEETDSGTDIDEDESNEPSSSIPRSVLWKRESEPRSCHPSWEDSLPDPPAETKAPIGYFCYFFDDGVLGLITEQSNLCSSEECKQAAVPVVSRA